MPSSWAGLLSTLLPNKKIPEESEYFSRQHEHTPFQFLTLSTTGASVSSANASAPASVSVCHGLWKRTFSSDSQPHPTLLNWLVLSVTLPQLLLYSVPRSLLLATPGHLLLFFLPQCTSWSPHIAMILLSFKPPFKCYRQNVHE